eukprot:CAMPEP_0119105092 /NCGR_PEP_ID=MMETSP1180-20130426/3149_1 /TAXON_ID=3052 ORGANISM="Chlamydomonas cf sp, Strain CCMP681" /NCGR_SAMPLE_ID=MMETSP1180 /ASSEMBLY_ACC=CAM_ASM_000741 /LENGTH=596 /DNA_ID=CAMNT_0007090057 /DNA_START=170 /DNA_END=1960 /DNA_ORIENTATION=+
MWDAAGWADGTAYVSQCPLPSGANQTISFLADESPGTYLWHDHSAANRANGLTGALILDLPNVTPPIADPIPIDGEFTVFVTDWSDQDANVGAMLLNRPIDSAKVTNDSGSFVGGGRPSALLINGKGVAADCGFEVHTGVKSPYEPPICNVTKMSVAPSVACPSGATHEQYNVEPGKQYLFRLINAGSSLYTTVCFEGHKVQLITADATPINWVFLSNGCIDMNTGQRYDILLTTLAVTTAAPSTYWISAHSQMSAGSPSAYAVLRYASAPAAQLPATPTPQGYVEPWTDTNLRNIVTADGVLGYLDNYEYWDYWQMFAHRGLYTADTLHPGTVAARLVVLNMTAPVLAATGQLRWAMNNVALMENPPCDSLLNILRSNSTWLADNTINPEDEASATAALLSVQVFNKTSKSAVYLDDAGWAPPIVPVAGMHVVELKFGEIVDVLMQNLPMGANNGEYRTGVHRNISVPHPMHLHGHKYWVLGWGDGIYDPIVDGAALDTTYPMLRDTTTLPAWGWLYIRFQANNPGIWPLHCHIMSHMYMGQMVYFAEAMDMVPPPPETGHPKCPETCVSSFAPYSKSWINSTYAAANSRFQLPK